MANKSGRKAQRRKELEQKKRRRNLTFIIPIGLGLLALIAFIVIRNVGVDIEDIIDFGLQERGHDQAVVIEEGILPPVGGIHSPRWQNCGIYDQPVEPKNAIHSMEHGAVWIAYRPELPVDQVAALQEMVQGQTYLLLSPFPELASNVVLTAWGVQLQLDSATDERLDQFVDQYRLGPKTPEFGAACDGGIGLPIG